MSAWEAKKHEKKKKSAWYVTVTPLATLSSDKMLMFIIIIGKNTSIRHSITRDVSMGSKVQLFFALLLIRGQLLSISEGLGIGGRVMLKKISRKCILVEKKTCTREKKCSVAWKTSGKMLHDLTSWTVGHDKKHIFHIVEPPLTTTFFVPGDKKSIHWLLFKTSLQRSPLYNAQFLQSLRWLL